MTNPKELEETDKVEPSTDLLLPKQLVDDIAGAIREFDEGAFGILANTFELSQGIVVLAPEEGWDEAAKKKGLADKAKEEDDN